MTGQDQPMRIARARGARSWPQGAIAAGRVSPYAEGWKVDVCDYFTIGPLARALGTTTRALRHYELEGLIEADRRGTTRVFSPEQRERVLFVIEARRVNIGIADIRHLLSLDPPERSRRKAELLQAELSSLDAARATLASELAKIRSQL